MTISKSVAPLALLLLAACDASPEPQNVTKIKIDNSAYVDRLRALSPQYRDLAIRRAIQDSGNSCRRIEISVERGTYENLSMWAARCEGGREWGVFVAPSGDVQVRSCGHLAQLGLPTCDLPQS